MFKSLKNFTTVQTESVHRYPPFGDIVAVDLDTPKASSAFRDTMSQLLGQIDYCKTIVIHLDVKNKLNTRRHSNFELSTIMFGHVERSYGRHEALIDQPYVIYYS